MRFRVSFAPPAGAGRARIGRRIHASSRLPCGCLCSACINCLYIQNPNRKPPAFEQAGHPVAESKMKQNTLPAVALTALLSPLAALAGQPAEVEIYDRTDGRLLPIYWHAGERHVAG